MFPPKKRPAQFKGMKPKGKMPMDMGDEPMKFAAGGMPGMPLTMPPQAQGRNNSMGRGPMPMGRGPMRGGPNGRGGPTPTLPVTPTSPGLPGVVTSTPSGSGLPVMPTRTTTTPIPGGVPTTSPVTPDMLGPLPMKKGGKVKGRALPIEAMDMFGGAKRAPAFKNQQKYAGGGSVRGNGIARAKKSVKGC